MSSSPRTLTDIATEILAHARALDDFIATNNLPQPSFAPDALATLPIPPSNDSLRESRQSLMQASQEIYQLAAGPAEHLHRLCWLHGDSLSVRALTHFRIPEAVPLDGELSFEQIARDCNVDLDRSRRVIRHAMTNNLFQEPRPGFVAHTAASALLVKDQGLRHWVHMNVAEIWPAMSREVEAIEKYPGSEEPDQTGFCISNNTESVLFKELAKYPERAKVFAMGLGAWTNGEGFELDHLINGYPWVQFGKGTVVDVGGSHGFVSVALAEAYPELSFVVQDLPHTADEGNAFIPAHLKDRVTTMGHDFFTEQPVKGADVYFFRWIFHNWSTKYSIKILQSIIPAMKPGSRVIINDICLPEPNTIARHEEKNIRTMDLMMMALLNARERSVADFAELFAAADPRLKFSRAIHPEKSNLWIVEAIFDPEGASDAIIVDTLASTQDAVTNHQEPVSDEPAKESAGVNGGVGAEVKAETNGLNVPDKPAADNLTTEPATSESTLPFIPLTAPAESKPETVEPKSAPTTTSEEANPAIQAETAKPAAIAPELGAPSAASAVDDHASAAQTEPVALDGARVQGMGNQGSTATMTTTATTTEPVKVDGSEEIPAIETTNTEKEKEAAPSASGPASEPVVKAAESVAGVPEV
ncbi:MAG: hypothetical protein M1819_004480 [Sarea resinae]|nr:MAG: hypothetical protein M1819_004480 [Sarea resinae]